MQNELIQQADADEAGVEQVFATAAELFAVLATPIRLRILNAICNREQTVGAIMQAVRSTQPNVSQHLRVLYQSGIVAKRRDGNQVFYRVQSEKAVQLCRTVCTQIAIELDDPEAVAQDQRLSGKV